MSIPNTNANAEHERDAADVFCEVTLDETHGWVLGEGDASDGPQSEVSDTKVTTRYKVAAHRLLRVESHEEGPSVAETVNRYIPGVFEDFRKRIKVCWSYTQVLESHANANADTNVNANANNNVNVHFRPNVIRIMCALLRRVYFVLHCVSHRLVFSGTPSAATSKQTKKRTIIASRKFSVLHSLFRTLTLATATNRSVEHLLSSCSTPREYAAQNQCNAMQGVGSDLKRSQTHHCHANANANANANPNATVLSTQMSKPMPSPILQYRTPTTAPNATTSVAAFI